MQTIAEYSTTRILLSAVRSSLPSITVIMLGLFFLENRNLGTYSESRVVAGSVASVLIGTVMFFYSLFLHFKSLKRFRNGISLNSKGFVLDGTRGNYLFDSRLYASSIVKNSFVFGTQAVVVTLRDGDNVHIDANFIKGGPNELKKSFDAAFSKEGFVRLSYPGDEPSNI